jgi:nucleotide-binding universal stress UspA family protein
VTYTTLMAHLELGRSNADLLRVAGDLAERFKAGVIGIAMCQPMQIIYSEGYIPVEIIDQDREQREKEIAAAEAEFREALPTRVRGWRASVTPLPLADYLAGEARAADLIITGVDHNASLFDNSRHVNIGDVVMQAGRPILVVPAAASGLSFDRVLFGWKDTRETRRAITDALPFLKHAAQVMIVEIADEQELEAARGRLGDVVLWLGRHGVVAEPIATPSTHNDAHQLHALALEHKAGLIVAGAYGHSRVREWVLGGVTRDLLLRAGRCALVSH